MIRKILLSIPVALLMSCGANEDSSTEMGENEKSGPKAENSITIYSVNAKGKEEKELATYTGKAAEECLIGLETLVHVKVSFEEGVSISEDQVLECLKSTTFTYDEFSFLSSEECMEDASGVKLKPSASKNKRTIKGKEVYLYDITYLKSK